MRIRRLGWAGIELESQGQSLVIDHIQTAGSFEFFLGSEPDEFLFPSREPVGALLTHLHRDHADVAALADVLHEGAAVLRPPRVRFMSPIQEVVVGATEAELVESHLDPREMAPGDVTELGPFAISAVNSVDGLGSNQVGWLIECDGEKVLHAGDTIWHRFWWEIAAEHGPIDAVCLPGNGVAIDYPFQQPALDSPATLTPEQAADAAFALGAGQLVPIHFNHTFIDAAHYQPVEGARGRIEERSAERDVAVAFPKLGEWIEVRPVVAA